MTTRIVSGGGTDLVTEQGALHALALAAPRVPVPGSAVPRGTAAAVLAALAEQLRKKTHGRFPSHETDPPVGQDRPSMLSLADTDAQNNVRDLQTVSLTQCTTGPATPR
ncbi:hypothetical protein GCM10027091_80530 [Streptomyces daliensis]